MKIQILIFATTCSLIMTTVYGAPTYSGTCQDVGYNDKGENLQINCGGGNLSTTGCTAVNKGFGVLRIICRYSKYRYVCGNSYRGNWHKMQNDNYKCLMSSSTSDKQMGAGAEGDVVTNGNGEGVYPLVSQNHQISNQLKPRNNNNGEETLSSRLISPIDPINMK